MMTVLLISSYIVCRAVHTELYALLHSYIMCTETREESRKQALDLAWSMEMSKLTRDGAAEPVSRDQILRRERGQRIIHFPCSVAVYEQDWQPRPVVSAIHTKIVLHTHTVVVTHIYAYYTTTVNRARMYMSPNKKYTGN